MENLYNSQEKAKDKSCQKCGTVKWETKERKCNICSGEMKVLGQDKEKCSKKGEGIL